MNKVACIGLMNAGGNSNPPPRQLLSELGSDDIAIPFLLVLMVLFVSCFLPYERIIESIRRICCNRASRERNEPHAPELDLQHLKKGLWMKVRIENGRLQYYTPSDNNVNVAVLINANFKYHLILYQYEESVATRDGTFIPRGTQRM